MIDAGARAAWEGLGEQLRPFIARRVPAPADVDDVLQDVFLRMQRGLPALRDRERFGPWVYQVARSAIAEHHRTRARHPPAPQAAPPEPAVPAEAEDSDADGSDDFACDLAGALAPFVAALPSPYREAITLTELEGLTRQEAARMLGVSVSGMKSRVQRGRARLREMLEACCEIELDARRRVIGCRPRTDGEPAVRTSGRCSS
ncbi:MAG TPA: sigma-70 family RNA polymerase sigma factor [Myxococcota bacterium]|nr:sigma-70 family RNA polymerase sigma factor [Myxococcota bacterium]